MAEARRRICLVAVAWLAAAAPAVSGTGDVPVGGEALLAWLETGAYRAWRSESRRHRSAGPHFGKVRAYFNRALEGSLAGGASRHPPGAAAVKELYGMGGSVLGWSVSVKLEADSAAGANWYWFEYFDGRLVADARGQPLCSGCHAAGKDLVLSPWPLR